MEARIKRSLTKGWVVAWVFLVIQAAAPSIFGQTVAYTGSLQFATGDYIFDQRTSGISLLNGINISLGKFNISASIPVIYQSTPYVSYSGIGIIPSGGSQNAEVKGRQGKRQVVLPEEIDFNQFGIGDPLIHADLELVKEGKALPSIRLITEIKAPLASIDQGFGTGEWDFSGGLSLAKVIGSSFVFVDVVYWVLGDLPDLELKNTLLYSIAFGLPLADRKCAFLASFSGQTSIIDGVKPPAQIGAGISFRMDSKKSLMFNTSFGLTESAPEFSASLGWSIRF